MPPDVREHRLPLLSSPSDHPSTGWERPKQARREFRVWRSGFRGFQF